MKRRRTPFSIPDSHAMSVRDALAQEMWRHPKAEIIAAQPLGSRSGLEGLAEAQLTGLIRRLNTRYETRGFVNLVGLGVGVKCLDRDPQQLQHDRRQNKHSQPGLGLRPLLVLDNDDTAVVIAYPEIATSLAPHEQQSGVPEVDDIVDQEAKRLGDSEPHHALQPQHQLMDRMKMRSDPRALRKVQRTRLGRRASRTSNRRVRRRRHQALGGIEAGWHQPVRPGERQDSAKHPQGVDHDRLGRALPAGSVSLCGVQQPSTPAHGRVRVRHGTRR